MVPELKADSAEIRRHLAHITRRWHELDQPVVLELVFLTDDDQARVSDVSRFPPTEDGISQAAEHAAAMNKYHRNCYAVVNPIDATKPLKTGSRASTGDIVASFFHWADADDAQAAQNIKSFVGPRCTFFVLTGTQPSQRPHVYWELEEPARNMAAWSQIQSAIAATLKTDAAVVDPPRIMRLGGTINWPKPKKIEKGYIPELTTLRIYDEDERQRVSSEQMARAFAGVKKPQDQSGVHIDTGGSYAPPLDRARTAIQALRGENWNPAVFKLVGSYVRKGLSDEEIHDLTDRLTIDGYTVDQTRAEVQNMIDRTRRNPNFQDDDPPSFAPNFDHAPAPTQSDPSPKAATWRVQRANEFTADFVAPEYIVDGIIQRGRLYTMTAPTGSGKTAVMLYASTAIATGTPFCEKEVEPGDVLFMAGENPDDVRARVIATMEFYNIDPATCNLHFIAGTFSIRADMERLRAEAEKLPNLILVVIDTFAAYFDGDDENSNAQALDFARLVRKIAAFGSKPAVIMPAHPVKNATKGNLTPKGGSSLLNEVDGNLTLWNEGGILSMHWQGKFRGAEFEPLHMELQRFETASICDNQGRIIPTILAKPLLETRAIEIATENLSREDRVLLSIARDPALSARERCVQCRMTLNTGKAATGALTRVLNKLRDQKLIRRFRTNWELTKDGEKAVEMLRDGQPFAKEI